MLRTPPSHPFEGHLVLNLVPSRHRHRRSHRYPYVATKKSNATVPCGPGRCACTPYARPRAGGRRPRGPGGRAAGVAGRDSGYGVRPRRRLVLVGRGSPAPRPRPHGHAPRRSRQPPHVFRVHATYNFTTTVSTLYCSMRLIAKMISHIYTDPRKISSTSCGVTLATKTSLRPLVTAAAACVNSPPQSRAAPAG